jgi:predicted PurR-regulated permease PerM
MSRTGDGKPIKTSKKAARKIPGPTAAAPVQVTNTPVPPETPPALTEVRVDPLSPPWGLTTKAIIASAILILGALAIWRFQFLISPIVLAAVIAYLLNPLISSLQRSVNITRPQAVLIIYTILLIRVGIGSFFLGAVIAQQSVRFWDSLPEFLPRLIETVQQRAQAWANVHWTLGPYSFAPGAVFAAIDWENLTTSLANTLRTVAGRSGLWLASVASAALSTLSDALFVLIVSIYLAMDGPRIGRGIGEIANQPGYRRDAERLIHHSILIWNAYLRGQVILGLVIFALVSTGLSILRVNNAFELGVLSGLLEFLPVIGPFIGAAAAVIVALVQDSNAWGLSPWVFALVVLGLMILIQQVENAVLVPRIVGEALDLHALVVLIGVLMGTSLAGLLGAVLAAPVIATLKLYGTYVWRKMLDLPPFPDDPPDPVATDKNGGNGVVAWLTGWFGSLISRT